MQLGWLHSLSLPIPDAKVTAWSTIHHTENHWLTLKSLHVIPRKVKRKMSSITIKKKASSSLPCLEKLGVKCLSSYNRLTAII